MLQDICLFWKRQWSILCQNSLHRICWKCEFASHCQCHSETFPFVHILISLFTNSMKDVERRTENVNKDENPSGWRPYCIFVEALRERCAKNEVFQGRFCNFFSILIIILYGMTLHYKATNC